MQTLSEDELLKATKGKSVEDLEKGVFKEKQVTGLTEAEYLVWQMECHKRTGKHLDESACTWLAESERPVSGRVPNANWLTDDDQLVFYSFATSDQNGSLGCRLAGSFLL